MKHVQQAGFFFIIASLILSHFLIPPVSVEGAARPVSENNSQQGGWISMTTPATCPPGGCAAGQSLGFKLDFTISGQDDTLPSEPNIKACLYAPGGWLGSSNVEVSASSLSANIPFSEPDPVQCEDFNVPSGYELIAVREAAYPAGGFIDALEFGFRLSPVASGTGAIVAHVLKRVDANQWVVATDAFIPSITLIPPANPSYVATAPALCGSAKPCYVDSAGDFEYGLGTGLKDAVDAVSPGSTVRILGTYEVKSKTVAINQSIVLEGQDNATISYGGANPCSDLGPILSINHGVTLRNLNINDGACTSPDRSLIRISRDASVVEDTPVLIEGNTFTGGDNVLLVEDAPGPITVRYNQIRGNAGFALYWNSANAATLEMVANNLYENVNGVECSVGAGGVVANRNVNHNYWGGGFTTDRAPHCTVDAKKRLFAPIVKRTGLPGVNAALIMVEDTKKAVLSGDLSIRRTNYDQSYPLYVVDHGYPLSEKMPYAEELPNSHHPCSNLYDVFLPSGVAPGGTLELYVKFNKTAICDEIISTNAYRAQTSDKTKYPLYWWFTGKDKWYTTRTNIPDVANGQETECSTGDEEVRVLIDGSGKKPGFSDLTYTPFMVGIPLIKTSSLTAGDEWVKSTWQTTYEPDLSGFYVQRWDGDEYIDVSALIRNTGSAKLSASYTYTDDDVENDVEYTYRLKIMRSDGLFYYYPLGSATPKQPTDITRTPTRTATRTVTRTVQPGSTTYYASRTPTATRILTRVPTRNFTPTINLTPSATGSPNALGTRTETSQVTPSPSVTPSATSLPGTPTPTRRVTRTPAVTLALTAISPATSGGGVPSWLSLLLGLLAGTVTVAAAGYWWYSRMRS